jgi:hypothetical protein
MIYWKRQQHEVFIGHSGQRFFGVMATISSKASFSSSVYERRTASAMLFSGRRDVNENRWTCGRLSLCACGAVHSRLLVQNVLQLSHAPVDVHTSFCASHHAFDVHASSCPLHLDFLPKYFLYKSAPMFLHSELWSLLHDELQIVLQSFDTSFQFLLSSSVHLYCLCLPINSSNLLASFDRLLYSG